MSSRHNRAVPVVFLIGALIIGLILISSPVKAQAPGFNVVTPITNEISYYKNIDDLGDSRGTTLQIISINEFDIGTNFIIEFTGDFNWNLDLYEDYDYYLELSLVKPIYKSVSLNYQRIYGTFVSEPINQFGVRISLFAQ